MNCANHPQTPAAAYCRTCGKPLCTTCSRPVMGVIYCETCLADRVAGTVPPTAYRAVNEPAAGVRLAPPPGSSGPNPGLAGVLGAIPFGVGAIYNGQYTKGLVHLAIFIFLVVSLSSDLPDYWYPILGIGMAFFVVYQIIDAVRTARAIQANQPPPDPFGLATMFSPGERTESNFGRNVPTAAVVLIGLGVLFLLHNLGFWFIRADIVWPVVLIVIGVWLFARRKACIDRGDERSRGFVGPAVLITLGGLKLISNLNGPPFHQTWPVIFLVVGIVILLERGGYFGGPSSNTPATSGTEMPSPQQTSPEVKSEVKNG